MEAAKESVNVQKKFYKKHRRCQAIAQKESGITCCDGPTQNLLICNAGLSNGLTEETLIDNYLKFGPLQDIVMLPGKSCCFITFKNIDDAAAAYNATNGKLNIAQDNKPIFLAYTKSLPQNYISKYDVQPPGLIVLHDFVTDEEERVLLSINDFASNDGGALKHRQVKHYGYEFRYDINNVDANCPLDDAIPKECDFIWTRLQSHDVNFHPDQLTINYYKPGHGIPPHVDTHSAFEDPILSLSLGSDVVMDFRHLNGTHLNVFLPRRSLLVISGESRYDWTHGITPRKYDIVPGKIGNKTVQERGTRTSFTFRLLRRKECACSYTDMCDSYKRRKIGDASAASLEKLHVHEVYENIASHFSDTRHKPWPNVLRFVQDFHAGSVILDIGCGNGKYLGQNKNVYDLGCDTSFGLIDVCRTRGFEVLAANCLQVPFKDEVADGVISIAVIHHLSTESRRQQAINEIIRLLRPNGLALIYVWAKNQCKDQKSSYLKQDRKNRHSDSPITITETKNINVNENLALPVHTNRKQFQHQDVLVPWKLKAGEEFLRYYHVYEEGELEDMCKSFKNVEIVNSYYDQGNWCVIFRKT